MKCNIFLFFLLAIAQWGRSQNTIGLPQIINFTKNDFKGGTQTWDIEQDKNGQMYFANNEGLITYDGTYWKTYPLPNKTILRSIAISSNGLIYAGGQGEMGFFSANQQGFLHYTSLIPLLPEKNRTFADIWDIEIIGNSVFFRAGDRMIFELKNNSFAIYPPISEWIFMKATNGRLYAHDRAEGLFYFNKNSWKPVHSSIKIENDAFTTIVPLLGNQSLGYTFQGRQYIIEKDSLYAPSNFNPPNNGSNVYKAAAINGNEFALTTSQGCLILDKKGKLIQQISRKEGLQNNNVLSVYLDRNKNLWVGLNNGISFIAYNAAVKYISPNKENEVSGFTSGIFQNRLYVGTSEGAYQVPLSGDSKDLSFSKGDFNFIQNSYGQVWRINEINQKLLMGHTRGCFEINQQSTTQISKDPGWLFVPWSPIIPSKEIIAGTYMGLKLLQFSNGQFIDMGNLKGTFESLRFLAIDNQSRLWASHPYRGIYLITLSSDKKYFESKLFTDKDGLPSTLDNHVYKINNRIVFATSKGAYEFDEANSRFIPSPYLSPIIGKTDIRYLNEDEEGNIWFCSGKRLGVVPFNTAKGKLENKLTYFPEVTGQILSGFENVYPYNSQNIFISSEKGIIHLNYEKYKQIKSIPNVILSTVKAIGKTDSIIFGGASVNNNTSKSESPSLPKNFNSFHFEYSSPAFGIQNNIEYSYMLKGFENKWSNWTNKAEKDYTNLSNGKYVFQVKSRDNLGNESEPISYTFYVAPPWYKTIWAYLAYLMSGVLFFYTMAKYQKRKLNIQRLKYEEKQRQITIMHQLELEKNEKEIIRLKNEKLESEILLKTKELADTSMHLVERSDALLKVKEELQKLYKNTNENHDIKKTLHLLNDIEKNNENWENFASHFDEVNNNFLKNLKHKFPKLTNSDLKVCAYLQLNLSSKEISQLMNISVRGVEISRYRLRKKLGIPTEQSLLEFLNEHSA